MSWLFSFFLAVIVALPSLADWSPERVEDAGTGCAFVYMCKAQSGTGNCTKTVGGVTNDVVAQVTGKSQLTFDSLGSAGSYVCDIKTASICADAATCTSQKINTTSLSPSSPVLSFRGTFRKIWVTCPTNASTTTVTLLACEGSR